MLVCILPFNGVDINASTFMCASNSLCELNNIICIAEKKHRLSNAILIFLYINFCVYYFREWRHHKNFYTTKFSAIVVFVYT